MLSPFDIRFFRELKVLIEAEKLDFHNKISAAKSFDEVRYHLGYMEALEDILKEGEEIERKLTSGNE